MASSVKKAIIYTLIAAAAVPLGFVLDGWFSVLPFAVMVWFAPLTIGEWYCVSVERAAKKQEAAPNCDRSGVIKGCMVFLVVLGALLTIGLYGVLGLVPLAIIILLYCFEYAWFSF